jgi:hypothetical protein
VLNKRAHQYRLTILLEDFRLNPSCKRTLSPQGRAIYSEPDFIKMLKALLTVFNVRKGSNELSALNIQRLNIKIIEEISYKGCCEAKLF